MTARPRAGQQWFVLTSRMLGSITRSGEILFAAVAPALFAMCFYLPLRSIMNAYPGMNYAQYLMPIIALQSIGFASTSSAMRASYDGDQGITTRLRSLPLPRPIPVLARTAANAVMLLVVLVCALIACTLIGWRASSLASAVLVIVAAFVIGMVLVLLSDAVGMLSPGPEATSQMMGLPIMLLAMVSTGFIPEAQFPEWIQPFVRNQPISQFATTLRDINDGTVDTAQLTTTLWWLGGLLVLFATLMAIAIRKRRA
uniref:ABC transporter permease n=1 Tax=Gordonia sp. B7-2 TaxID=3420932 RepID=UPI003D9468A2